jgi:hypothetical protein
MKFVLTLLFKCSNVQTIHCSGQRSNMLLKEEVHCTPLHSTALHFDIYCFMMNEELSWALGKYPKTLSLVFSALDRCNYANPEQEECSRTPKNPQEFEKVGNSSSSWV